MAAISDAELLRKIFNHPANKPITNHMVSDALSPRPYQKRREIMDRLVAQDEVGWVHTHAGRITSIEDFRGIRKFEEDGDVYVSRENGLTTDRQQRANVNNGSMSYLFLRNPAVGLSLWDVENQVTRMKDEQREQRERERRERANSPVGQAERALILALGCDTASIHLGTIGQVVTLAVLNQQQVDHLVMVLRANPYQGDKA